MRRESTISGHENLLVKNHSLCKVAYWVPRNCDLPSEVIGGVKRIPPRQDGNLCSGKTCRLAIHTSCIKWFHPLKWITQNGWSNEELSPRQERTVSALYYVCRQKPESVCKHLLFVLYLNTWWIRLMWFLAAFVNINGPEHVPQSRISAVWDWFSQISFLDCKSRSWMFFTKHFHHNSLKMDCLWFVSGQI